MLRFTEGMSWSEELKEFELVAWTAPRGDAEAYGHSLEEPEDKSDDLKDAWDDLRNDLGDLEQEHIDDMEKASEDMYV